jgi:hypothetical protein
MATIPLGQSLFEMRYQRAMAEQQRADIIRHQSEQNQLGHFRRMEQIMAEQRAMLDRQQQRDSDNAVRVQLAREKQEADAKLKEEEFTKFRPFLEALKGQQAMERVETRGGQQLEREEFRQGEINKRTDTTEAGKGDRLGKILSAKEKAVQTKQANNPAAAQLEQKQKTEVAKAFRKTADGELRKLMGLYGNTADTAKAASALNSFAGEVEAAIHSGQLSIDRAPELMSAVSKYVNNPKANPLPSLMSFIEVAPKESVNNSEDVEAYMQDLREAFNAGLISEEEFIQKAIPVTPGSRTQPASSVSGGDMSDIYDSMVPRR